MTEEKLTIQQKLIQIQSELKVPKNNFSEYGGYNFRNAEDILKAVKKHNLEYGLLLTLTDVPLFIEGRFYIRSTATLSDGKESVLMHMPEKQNRSPKWTTVSSLALLLHTHVNTHCKVFT